MADFTVHILGCGSALPTTRHLASSQVVDLRDKLYMIDCGEGTQLQMRRTRIKFARLNHVFISHMHGDHCFGLPGLVSTLGMLGRNGELWIHGPAALGEYVESFLRLFCQGLPFAVHFNPVDASKYGLVMEDRSVSVYSIPLKPTGDGGPVGFGLFHSLETPDTLLRLFVCGEAKGTAYHSGDGGFLSGAGTRIAAHQAGG